MDADGDQGRGILILDHLLHLVIPLWVTVYVRHDHVQLPQ